MAEIELTIKVDEDDARGLVEDYCGTAPLIRIERIARAIESALPKPRPAEPMGLGAVVRDGEGRDWVRNGDIPNWQSAIDRYSKEFRHYDELPDPIEVLSEGVIL